ncbi:MAG TPA: hypothetical protein VHC04_08965 [Rhodopila sp.]|nr:hypothetical protein [Rhodopila sp.]
MATAVLSGAVVPIGPRPSRRQDLHRFLGGPGTILPLAAAADWAAARAAQALAAAG